MCYTFYSTEGPVCHVCALEFMFLLYGVLRAAAAASIIYATSEVFRSNKNFYLYLTRS
jgi:hypothetical protein